MYKVEVVISKCGAVAKHKWENASEEDLPRIKNVVDNWTIFNVTGKLVSYVIIPQVTHIPG